MTALPRYQVTAHMMGGHAKGQRVRCVVSRGSDPYTTTDETVAKRVAAELRGLPEAYREVRVEERVQ